MQETDMAIAKRKIYIQVHQNRLKEVILMSALSKKTFMFDMINVVRNVYTDNT